MTKNNTYKLTPTLNNLSYKILITDASKELQIVLPCSTLPDKFKVFKQQMTNKKKKAVVIEPTDPVRICVLFVNKTNDKIDVALTSNSSESKINGQVALKPNACQFFEFYSANGGLNWFVDALGKQDDETKVNGKPGPDITLDANDIKLSANDPDSITIKEKLDELSEVKIAGPDTVGGIIVSELGDINVDSNGVVTIKDGSVSKSKLSTEVQADIDSTKSDLDTAKTNIESLRNDVNKNKEDISTTQANLDSVKASVKDINDNLSKDVMDIIADNASNIIIESFNV